MDIIAFTLAQFEEQIPTHSHLIQTVWRPYFHKLKKEERPVFTAIVSYAAAYHQLKDAENNHIHLFKIDNLKTVHVKNDYKSLVNSKGEVNPHLPSILDIEVLKKMYESLKAKQDSNLQALTIERQAMIDKEMIHVRNTLRALDKRLSAKGLNYSIEQESWVDYIEILDEKTNKKHIGELRQPLITKGE